MLTLGRLRGAGQDLWPRRRHGSRGDARQGDPGRARRRARAAARRRRHAAGLLHGAAIQGRRHDRGDAGAGRRGDHRALGVHAGRRAGEPSCSATSIRPGSSGIPFLAGNVRDTDFEEPVFHATRFFEKGGVSVAVIGQAFPYTPIANPRWMIPQWSFGIREDEPAQNRCRGAAEGRRGGGAAVAQRLRRRPQARRPRRGHRRHPHRRTRTMRCRRRCRSGRPLLIASGSHGKFLSRLDLEVDGRAGEGLLLRPDPDACGRDRA